MFFQGDFITLEKHKLFETIKEPKVKSFSHWYMVVGAAIKQRHPLPYTALRGRIETGPKL
jgi:hypothetical protein